MNFSRKQFFVSWVCRLLLQYFPHNCSPHTHHVPHHDSSINRAYTRVCTLLEAFGRLIVITRTSLCRIQIDCPQWGHFTSLLPDNIDTHQITEINPRENRKIRLFETLKNLKDTEYHSSKVDFLIESLLFHIIHVQRI